MDNSGRDVIEPWQDVDQHPALIAQAKEYWLNKKDEAILTFMDNMVGLEWVGRHLHRFTERGTYEKVLLAAWSACRVNWSHYPIEYLRILFAIADREKMVSLGDPLPKHETFTLYRGVTGTGRRRRVSGISRTSDPQVATWFAKRFTGEPAVYRITVNREMVYARLHESGRHENEYIVPFLQGIRPRLGSLAG